MVCDDLDADEALCPSEGQLAIGVTLMFDLPFGCNIKVFVPSGCGCRFLQDFGNIPVDAISVVCGEGEGGCKV